MDLRFQQCQDLRLSVKDNENEFQLCCWMELVKDLGPNAIIGCCYYRHPKKSSNNKFLEQLKITLTKIKTEINI